MNHKGAPALGIRKKRRELSPATKSNLISELKAMVQADIRPLPEEPNFTTNESTLARFLMARNFVVKDAFKMLRNAVEWRRSYRPLTVECNSCTVRPGYHGIRQIGFDIKKRPVLYACFNQCQTLKNTPEDIIQHVTYLVENCFRCHDRGCDELVIVLDCSGLTLGCCNPKIGRKFVQNFSDNYPEKMGRFYLINYNSTLYCVWKAIKVFIDPNTVKKVHLVKKEKLDFVLQDNFDSDTAEWLRTEIQLNQYNINVSQRRFWEGPRYTPGAAMSHDPRGAPSYVKAYIDPLAQRRAQRPNELLCLSTLGRATHLPHPNILQDLNGTLKNIPLIDLNVNRHKPSKDELEEYGVASIDMEDFSKISDDEKDSDDDDDDN